MSARHSYHSLPVRVAQAVSTVRVGWRLGTVDVAVGVSGLKPLKDDRGKKDRHGYELRASLAAVADEIASAAELVMGKRDGVPAVLIRGYTAEREEGSARELLRPETEDLFRNF